MTYKLTVLNSTLIIFCIFNVIITSQAQDGSFCRTPNQVAGTCMNIRLCNPLVSLLLTQGATPEVSNYLRRSACGWNGDNPLVCCPNIDGRTSVTNRPTEPSVSETNNENDDNSLRPPNCGRSNTAKSRIVNGQPALLGEYPWVVALGYRNSKNPNVPKWLCGATLVTDRHIVTAGHCVHNRPDLYLARMGALNLYTDDPAETSSTINLIRAKVHENYNPSSFINDIAILTLAQPHNNPTISPICLPLDDPIRSTNYTRKQLLVAGWGALYFNGPSSDKLLTTSLPVVSNSDCRTALTRFRTIIDDRVICAGYIQGGRDACQGDSGGPLMLAKNGSNGNFTFYLMGVVSYGFRCAEQGYPGVYTRITEFVDWIQNNLD